MAKKPRAIQKFNVTHRLKKVANYLKLIYDIDKGVSNISCNNRIGK